MQLVDVDQACGAGLEVSAVLVRANGTLKRISLVTREGTVFDLKDRLIIPLAGIILVLVVIVLVRLNRGGALCASLIGIDGRVFCKVVITIGRSRFKLRRCIAQILVAAPLVSIELHVANIVAICFDIGLHGGIRVSHKRRHARFKA